MQGFKRRFMVFCLAAVLASQMAFVRPTRAEFNDEYVFATTRSVNNLDANPALKVTLFPLTIVLDTLMLPFAVIAGFVT